MVCLNAMSQFINPDKLRREALPGLSLLEARSAGVPMGPAIAYSVLAMIAVIIRGGICREDHLEGDMDEIKAAVDISAPDIFQKQFEAWFEEHVIDIDIGIVMVKWNWPRILRVYERVHGTGKV
jgi:hypothetical protein